ncbi:MULTISPECIES: MFS transporter [unclassified Streptomyces]|uniref:MFS transporter n=1 Tax=Streptomyces sp. NBC_00119 TaxID=2975659 RepID=A0AAU1UBX5_9ACTN|nr:MULTISPECIES: MFS transporter [unclassified Streptomyces]MCX4645199.1 MFS transporter [Streptomyces sp. NBC_01446]MCX5326033.1 MFS transporter [Streptomyces sp. NBC_00120]
MKNSSPRPHPHKPGSPWTVAAGAALAIVTAGAFSTLAGLLVGPLHEDLGWSRASVGLGSLVNMVVYGASAPFTAALMDRLGMRRVAVGALCLVAAGAGLATTMTAPWQFVLYWGALVGLGTGATATTFAATVTERWFVARRGLVTGLLTAASVVGQFVFLPVLSWVIDTYSWRAAAAALALAAAGALPVVWAAVRDPRKGPALREDAARRALRTLARAARTGPFWLLAGTFAVCGASTNGVMWTHFAPAAHDHGMPVTVAASLLSLIGIFNVAGTVASGWLTDRADPRRLLAVYYALRGLTLLALPLLLTSAVDAPLVAFTVVFGLLDVATVPPTIALCRAHYGADAPVVFGWVSAAHQVGAGAVAFAGGMARDTFGSYDPVWVGAGALCAGAALLALTLRRPRGRRVTPPAPATPRRSRALPASPPPCR